MSKIKDLPTDTVKVVTMLRLDNGVVIDAEELTAEQREAYIEFAIHLAAPSIAKMLSHGIVHNDGQDIPDRHVVNESAF